MEDVMKKIIGYLKNLANQIFAKNAEGNLRDIYTGSPVYEGEIVVDAAGNVIIDALRPVYENDPDKAKEEADIEAKFSDDEQDDGIPEADEKKSTTSTDQFYRASGEVNIEAVLHGSEFHTQNAGLIQDHIGENETNINASLREHGLEEKDGYTVRSGAGAPMVPDTPPTPTPPPAPEPLSHLHQAISLPQLSQNLDQVMSLPQPSQNLQQKKILLLYQLWILIMHQ